MIDWSKLGKLIGMLGSEHDGERLNAARLLTRTLQGEGATFADLSDRVINGGHAPATRPVETPSYTKPPRVNPARDIAQKIIDTAGRYGLTRNEARFLHGIIRSCDMTGGWYELSSSQANWLTVLEQQHCAPKPKVRKARKPGPVPNGMYDECGLGDRPGKYTGGPLPRVMPDATIDEVIRRAHDKMGRKPWIVPQDVLDAIFGETPGTYKGEPHDPHAPTKRRFGALDIDT